MNKVSERKTFNEKRSNNSIHSTYFQQISLSKIEEYTQQILNDLERRKLYFDERNFYNLPGKGRPTLIRKSIYRDNYGILNHPVVEPYSSDDEYQNEEEIDERPKEPKVKKVCEFLFDQNTLMNIQSENDFPKGVRHGLLMKNIDFDMSAAEVKLFLEGIPTLGIKEDDQEKPLLDIDEIRIFQITVTTYACIFFNKKEECEKVYNFFNHPVKLREHPTQNANKENVEFSYCYDLSDLKNSGWYAVILRNLDITCSREIIEKFCLSFNKGVLYALAPVEINLSLCSIVVMQTLDDAEKLCILLNSKDPREISNGRKIKAHLHPKCSKLRTNPELSHFADLLVTDNNYKIKLKADKVLENFSPTKKKNKNSSVKSAKSTKFSPAHSDKNQKNMKAIKDNNLSKSLISQLCMSNDNDIKGGISNEKEDIKVSNCEILSSSIINQRDVANSEKDMSNENINLSQSSDNLNDLSLANSMVINGNEEKGKMEYIFHNLLSSASAKTSNKNIYINNKHIKKPRPKESKVSLPPNTKVVNIEDKIEMLKKVKDKELINNNKKDNLFDKPNSEFLPPAEIKNNHFLTNKKDRDTAENYGEMNETSIQMAIQKKMKFLTKSMYNPLQDTIPLGQGNKKEAENNTKFYSDFQKISATKIKKSSYDNKTEKKTNK